MFGGCTGIVTLLKPENRDFRQKPDDEQLHVLPHYRPDDTDEFGNVEGQQAKIQSGKKNINFIYIYTMSQEFPDSVKNMLLLKKSTNFTRSLRNFDKRSYS